LKLQKRGHQKKTNLQQSKEGKVIEGGSGAITKKGRRRPKQTLEKKRHKPI